MKKILHAGVSLILIFAFAAPVFAQQKAVLQPRALSTTVDPAPAEPNHDATNVQLQLRQLAPAVRNGIQKNNSGQNEAENKKGVFQNVFSEYGVQFLAMVLSLVGVIFAVSGFSIANSKKKKHMSTFMNEIDDAFHSFKWKSKRCEAELYRLHDMMEEKLKKGKLDESSYGLLSARIDKYLKEIHEIDALPEHLKKDRSND